MKKLLHLRLLSVLLLMMGAIGSAWAETWIKTDITDLQEGDVIAIVDISSANAMSNDKGTSSAPTAVSVTLSDDKTTITSSVALNIQFVFGFYKSTKDKYVFYTNAEKSKWLYCTNANNGVRIGTNNNSAFILDDGYLKNIETSRYVGVYSNSDWRCYTSTSTNISKTQVAFYKKCSEDVVTAPTIFPNGGTFTGPQEITLSADVDYIKYTTDGSTPTAENGEVYIEPFTISESCTVKAIALDEDMNASAVASANFIIKQSIANTQETAYTVEEAKMIIDDQDSNLDEEVYVKGRICKIDDYNSEYNSITYWISDDGSQTDMFEVYRGKGMNGADFESVDDIALQAEVIVYGKIKKFNSTYEFDYNNYLVSYKAKTLPEISFSTTEATYIMGRPFTAPTLNGAEDYDVVYISGDTNVATVTDDGVVTAVAPGATTITAMIDETEDHWGAEASYTLTVTSVCEITWSVNGVITTEEQLQGATLSFPEDTPASIGGKTFMGWTAAEMVNVDGSEITFIEDGALVPSTATVTYYAVYATTIVGSAQTEKTLYYEPFTGSAHSAGFAEDNVAATADMFYDKTATVWSHYSNVNAASTTSYATNLDGNDMSNGIKIMKDKVAGASVILFEVSGIDIQNASDMTLSLYNRRTHSSATLKVEYKIDSGDYQEVGGTMVYNDSNDKWKYCNGLTIKGTGNQLSLKFTMSVTGGTNRTMLLDDIKVTGLVSGVSYTGYTTTIPASQSVTISAAGYATFCSDHNLSVPEGVKAYKANAIGSDEISFTSIDEGVIPAGEGVLLKGAQGSYNFIVVNSATAVEGNIMVGCVEDVTLAQNEAYILGNKNSVVAFYLNNAGTLAKGKAYIPASAAGENARGLRISLSDETGVTTVLQEPDTEAIYNLAGQKVEAGYKGIVIKNGKKVLVK